MYLYNAVHFECLEDILDNGLGISLGETENLPFKLDKYADCAEARCMFNDYINDVDSFSDIVVLGVQETSMKDNCMERHELEDGFLIDCTYTDVIDSSHLILVWADYHLPLKEFMDLYAQQKDPDIAADGSETLMKCVQWFRMGIEKREAILNIIGKWRGSYFNELATLTGYSAFQLKDLWLHRTSAEDLFYEIKISYEKGMVLGMYEIGCSIEKIEKEANWNRKDILDLLQEKGYLNSK